MEEKVRDRRQHLASIGQHTETTVYDHPLTPINQGRVLLLISTPPPILGAENKSSSRTYNAHMQASKTLAPAERSIGARRVSCKIKVHRSTAVRSHTWPDAAGVCDEGHQRESQTVTGASMGHKETADDCGQATETQIGERVAEHHRDSVGPSFASRTTVTLPAGYIETPPHSTSIAPPQAWRPPPPPTTHVAHRAVKTHVPGPGALVGRRLCRTPHGHRQAGALVHVRVGDYRADGVPKSDPHSAAEKPQASELERRASGAARAHAEGTAATSSRAPS